MAKEIKIRTRIWVDNKMKRLPMQEKLVYMYLLSSPYNNGLGIYVTPEVLVAHDTKLTTQDVRQALLGLMEKGLIQYDFSEDVVFIVNFMRYNKDVEINFISEILDELPETHLIKNFLETLRNVHEGNLDLDELAKDSSVIARSLTMEEQEKIPEIPEIPEGSATSDISSQTESKVACAKDEEAQEQAPVASEQENEEKKDSIKELIHFQIDGNTDEKVNIIEKLFSKKMGSPLEIILSQEYWDVLLKQYEKYHEKGNFSIYYWTYRNIILNLLKIGQEDIPKADIYHCVTTGYAGFIGCLVAHRKMGKFLLTEHGIYPREREEEILGANWIDADFKNIWIDYFYYLSKLAYQYSDKIISLFEYTRGIQIYYGADEKKTKVIPNGVDEKKYGDIIKKKREGFHIGSVLRVVPIKDIKMMIKGFKIAEKNMPDATLWLIGPTDEDKEYYEECLELVKNLKLEEKVIFTGRANIF